MKRNPVVRAAGFPGGVFFQITVLLAILGFLPATAFCQPQSRQLSGHVPEALKFLKPIGSVPGDTQLRLAIALPLRNQEAITNLIHDLYDPASPRFRHFLSSDETTEMFGPTPEQFQSGKGSVPIFYSPRLIN